MWLRTLTAPLALLLAGCLELPASFEQVGFEQANRLLVDPAVTLVEIPAEGDDRLPGALAWSREDVRAGRPPEIAPGSVLLVGAEAASVYGAAALLVRSGNGPVRVFVPGSREERSRLVALATAKEDARGEGS